METFRMWMYRSYTLAGDLVAYGFCTEKPSISSDQCGGEKSYIAHGEEVWYERGLFEKIYPDMRIQPGECIEVVWIKDETGVRLERA